MADAILVTGGAGYIGSHTTVVLLQAGFDVVILDNLSNSSHISLERIEQITNKALTFINGDIRDRELLDSIFKSHKISAVLHFAGLKAVSESTHRPFLYYENNVVGTLNLCQSMANAGVFRLVFSSSATVYGEQPEIPFHEDMETGKPASPYGRSKLMVEQILRDIAFADSRWWMALLRYFNPVGAHESGLIGEDPSDIPNNLLPFITQVAVGRRDELLVFGDDYPTEDGTGVRDYIHIMDLAEGHLKALLAAEDQTGVKIWNLGTGQGISVLQMIRAFEAASGQQVPYRIASRRPGDIPAYWADSSKAERELGWRANRNIDDMMRDAWRWQSRNPNGYMRNE